MGSIEHRRIRAQVTEFWSEKPVDDAVLVQRVAEHANSLEWGYPDVKPVNPMQGIWDLYLPEELVRRLEKENATEFEIDTANRYFRVRFLDQN